MSLSAAFFTALVQICTSHGWAPEHLLGVMMSESGIDPKAGNPNGGAVGLIQFMSATLVRLGWKVGPGPFAQLSAEDQLPYVERYFEPYEQHELDSPERFYLATFLPAELGDPASRDPGFVLCNATSKLDWAYRANTVFDRNRNGDITLAEMRARLDDVMRGPRWDSIIVMLEAAREPNAPTLPSIEEPVTWHRVQMRLGELGFYDGVADGIPGPMTCAGVWRALGC